MELPEKTGLAKRIWQSLKAAKSWAAPNIVALTAATLFINPAIAYEASSVAATTAANEFTLEPDAKTYEKERKEIEAFLQNVEKQWNSHNLDGVMGSYSDDYVNNDGLDKGAVFALTQDFWKTYPDAKSSSKTKQIRVDGPFATVESRDVASGSTAKEMPGIQSKGELKSISEGQLYLRKIGTGWKIIGDRVDYEKVRVAFGLAKQVDASFTAPEQVRSGRQYSAKLDVDLPNGLDAVGSITSQPLQYPQPSLTEESRQIDGSLERIMAANANNRNELLMATVGLAKREGRTANLVGVILMSRRLNVVPSAIEDEKKKTEKTEKVTDEADKSKSEKDSKREENKTDKSTDSDSQEKKDADKPDRENKKDDDKPKSEIRQKDKKNRNKSAQDEESQSRARERRAKKAQEKREKAEKAKIKKDAAKAEKDARTTKKKESKGTREEKPSPSTGGSNNGSKKSESKNGESGNQPKGNHSKNKKERKDAETSK